MKLNLRKITAAVSSVLKLEIVLASTAVIVVGCASSDVNPRQARASMGYVDFYGKRASHLIWEVARFDDKSREFRRILSDWEAPPEGIIRLELVPGHHRLRFSCLNLSTTGPAEIEIAVVDGEITPVLVVMTKAGTTEVETAETSIGDTLYGRYGRRTKVSADEDAMYRISATAGPPAAYRLKSEMPYAQRIIP